MRFDRGITVSIEIDAPSDRVWDELEPIEHHVEWMADAEAITFLGDLRRGVGTRFRVDTRVGPFRLDDEMEITRWVDGAEMSVVHRGLVTGEGSFLLHPVGQRTRLEWSETLSFPWWMGGPIGASVGAFVLTRIWRANLARLRDRIESR